MEFKGNYDGDTVKSAFAKIIEHKMFVGTNIGTQVTDNTDHRASLITIPADVIQEGDVLQVRGIVSAETYNNAHVLAVGLLGPTGGGATETLVTTGNVDVDAGDYFLASIDVRIHGVASGTVHTATYLASLEWWDLSASTTAPTSKLHDLTQPANKYDTSVETQFAISLDGESMSANYVRIASFYCQLLRPNA